MRPLLPIALLAVATLPSVALAWQTAVTATPPAARPSAVAVDAQGDVVAVGRTVNLFGDEDALMVKLDGRTGAELWQRVTAGSAGVTDLLRAVAVDASGIVGAGQVVNATTAGDALVVKRDLDGGVLWQLVLDGGIGLEDDALAVALDATGDVLVGTQETPLGTTSARFTVRKRAAGDGAHLWTSAAGGQGGVARALAVDGAVVYAAGDIGNLIVVTALDGVTGVPAWRTDVAGSADAEDVGRALAVGGGRVVVAGRLVGVGNDPDFAVIALDAATGDELWRSVIDGTATGDDDTDDAFGVAVDSAGDVLAVGRIVNATTDQDLLAVKLDGATGTETWRTVVNGRSNNDDLAQALVLDPSGDLLVTGTLRSPGTRADLLVARFANATGAEQWRVLVDGSESGADNGLAVATASGALIVGGRVRNGTGDGFVVLKRSGSSGGDFPCGDGTTDAGEACDDANAAAGDGCRVDCTIELCGDGITDPQDECDDGDTTSGDCCSETCALETGACDDGDACTLGETCQVGVCTPASVVTCTPESPCHTASCDPENGTCVSTPKAQGALCDDANACTSLDRCFASLCTGTAAVSCSDEDPCTVDGCDPASGCTFTPYTSFSSVICTFERDRIANACDAGVPRPVRRRLDAARRLLGTASTTGNSRRALRALARAAKSLDKGRRLAEKQRRRDRITTECADVLDAELVDMASRTRTVSAELEP